MRYIVWFSCGAASTITAKIALRENPSAQLVYCDTGGEHYDNKRYLADVEKWLNVKVMILKNEKYKDHFDVYEKTKFLNSPNGARCTVELKKKLRFDFQQTDDVQFFGYTVEEQDRADHLVKAYPEIIARFPLIEHGITKSDCLGLLDKHGIEIPAMYRLGFRNNNCIGCVKGGMGYWNLIRVAFPDTFKRMMNLERSLGRSCISGKFLDELELKDGHRQEQDITCDFVCQSLDV